MQPLLAHQARAQSGQLALFQTGKAGIELCCHDAVEHAVAEELDQRRTEVKAEMRCGETITAIASAIFVRVDRAAFGIESP